MHYIIIQLEMLSSIIVFFKKCVHACMFSLAHSLTVPVNIRRSST